MPGIFISYRREDTSGYAGRLFDLLSERFGRERTFMDLDTIQGGDDFTRIIDEKVADCDVLLAVIGPKWLTCVGVDGLRRIDQADDFVRLEIAKAIDRGVRIIPVLVGGGVVPRQDEVPPDLRALSLRQAVELRDAYFRPDTERLMSLLGTVAPPAKKPSRPAVVGRALLVAVLLAAVAAGILLLRRDPRGAQSTAAGTIAQGTSVGLAGRTTAATARPAPVIVPPTAVARPRPQALPAIAGKWKATVKYDWPGAMYDETFDLHVDGTKVSGTASLLGAPRGIVSGTVEGARIRFTTRSATELSDRTYQETHTYRGTIAGDTIHFSMLTESELESYVPVLFDAKRVR